MTNFITGWLCSNSNSVYSSEENGSFRAPYSSEGFDPKLKAPFPIDKLPEEESALYLPAKEKGLKRLLYLINITKDGSQSPLTERQERVFYTSEKMDAKANNWLKFGCGAFLCAGGVACSTAGPGCFSASWILNTASMICGTISTGISYMSTGVYPGRFH